MALLFVMIVKNVEHLELQKAKGGENMIIAVTGKVKFPITLDASVWIFDDRRIKFEEAFKKNERVEETSEKEPEYTSAERFNREVFEATNDNKPIPKKDAEEILKSTLVMPFEPFYNNAEVEADAKDATIVQTDGNEVTITLDQLKNSLFLFAYEGKPLKEDGPVHIYFGDGSNKDNPIKAVKKIVIN